MALRLESRPVGDVLVIQCHGRIVAGNDVFALHAQVGDSWGIMPMWSSSSTE